MRDAGNHTGEQRPISSSILRIVQRPKAQAVQRRDRTRAHREDVAQNSTDARSGSLKGFDERRMIMRFDFEGGTPAVADIDDAGIFARGHNHALAFGRQTLQMNPRRFV